MADIKKRAVRKAAKVTVRHTARGVVSKARRRPFRSGSLIVAGVILGAAVTWVAKQVGDERDPPPGAE